MPSPSHLSSLRNRAVFLGHALRKGHYEHLAGRLAQDVFDRRREEARLPPPLRRRAADDQVVAAPGRLGDDRLADRAGAIASVRPGRPGPRRAGRPRPAKPQRAPPARPSSASIALSSGTRITKSASTSRPALGGELDRSGDHLLADRPELHRNEDARELRFGQVLEAHLDVLEQSLAASFADEPVDDEAGDEPGRAAVAGARVGRRAPRSRSQRSRPSRRSREAAPRRRGCERWRAPGTAAGARAR